MANTDMLSTTTSLITPWVVLMFMITLLLMGRPRVRNIPKISWSSLPILGKLNVEHNRRLSFNNIFNGKTRSIRSRPCSPVGKESSNSVYGNTSRHRTWTPPVVKRSAHPRQYLTPSPVSCPPSPRCYQPSPVPHRQHWVTRQTIRNRVNSLGKKIKL